MALEILIPYWGDPAYMKEAVRSVLAQTSPDWKLTVIDDAYPDEEVGRWLGTLADDRISYRRKPVNEGILANFRSCLRAASEPLMTMCGADDRLLPTYVADVLDASRRFPQAAIIQPGVQVIDGEGRATGGVVEHVKQRVLRPRAAGPALLGGEALATSLLHGNWLYWPSLAFRTERIQAHDFPEGFPIMLDLAIVLDMVFAGDGLLTLPGRAFQYRRHEASLSSAALVGGVRFTEERTFYAQAAARADALGWRRAARAARLRLTSRAHAALTLPRALLRRDLGGCRTLVRHALGS